jgi:hypothetical protein
MGNKLLRSRRGRARGSGNVFDTRYHQPSDDLSQLIEWEAALLFARAGARIGHRAAMKDQHPTWNEGDFFGEEFGH